MTLVSGRLAASSEADAALWRVLLVVVLAVAVFLRWIEPTNTDVSWLITLGERVLDGARPYRDFFEVNPPASIGLYLPGVALARALGMRPEAVIDGLVFAAGAASLWTCRRVLAATSWLSLGSLVMAAAVLFVLPANTFGEREHIVLMATLPLLACLALRASGKTPGSGLAVAAGLAAGVAVSVKPMFALAVAGPLCLVWASAGLGAALRSLETWIAAAVAALYGAGVLLLFPDFTQRVLPTVLLVYVPARLSAEGLLLSFGTLIWVLLALAWLTLPKAARQDCLAAVLGLSSIGFGVAFYVQGKGWAYHAYPALALMLMALAAALRQMTGGPLRRLALPGAALGLSAVIAFLWFDRYVDVRRDEPGLAAAITQVSPHPTLMAVTADIAVGHPLVRQLGGRWVGTFPSSWIHTTAAALALGASDVTRTALLDADRMERSVYAADIAREKPDVVLVDGSAWGSWIAGDADLTAAFAAYRPIGTFGAITLWRRATP